MKTMETTILEIILIARCMKEENIDNERILQQCDKIEELAHTFKSDIEWKEELQKCKDNPAYFKENYWKVYNEHKSKIPTDEEMESNYKAWFGDEITQKKEGGIISEILKSEIPNDKEKLMQEILDKEKDNPEMQQNLKDSWNDIIISGESKIKMPKKDEKISKFKKGDKVRIINYGHLYWENKSIRNEYFKQLIVDTLIPKNIVKETDDIYWCDLRPELVGKEAIIETISFTNTIPNYGLYFTERHSYSSWYSENQLELVIETIGV